jgi:ribosome assembly protein YihI (activator of Der GTPase)
VNVILIRDNNTYCVLCTNNDEKVINLQNYKLLKITNVKMSSEFNNFDIELVNNSTTEEELQKILKSYYAIENLEKPLKAFSSYKLDDLVSLAEKLNINVYDEHTKKKKKQELYENILQKLI